jgi:hypothetical protein
VSAGIWIYDRDETGTVSNVRIYVKPCINEPDPEALDERGVMHAWQHGLAEVVRDDGASLLCWPCARVRRDEEARQARLRALPPFAREFLARNGQEDWHVR